jgi:predicted GNAT family N-acyltransferase
MIEIRRILMADPEFQDYKEIRHSVFVDEQGVPEKDEFDSHEAESYHFLAFLNGIPVGTARWRKYEGRFKLERFAVLKKFRGKGIGIALVQHLENDIGSLIDLKPGSLFMNAQNQVIDFYLGLGYSLVGDEFEECGIKHTTMEK